MKYNLRTLKGKRIVGGDPNLATKNEIHVTKIPEQLGIEGGETEAQKEYYYLFDGEKYITDKGITEDNFSSLIIELHLLVGPMYSCLFPEEEGVHDYPNGVVRDKMLSSLAFWKKVLGVRFKDNTLIMSSCSSTQDIWIAKGDMYTRWYLLAKHAFKQEIKIDEIKEDLKKYFTEVTKEEYESYIDIPITIL